MRVNKTAPGYALLPEDDRPPKRVREYMGEYKPRAKPATEALPRNIDVMKRPTYRTGDGDTQQFYRPGSQDFLKCPSKLFLEGEEK